MTAEKKLTEDEYLKREAQLAQEALQRLRDEVTDSLRRAADLGAWTDTYPIPVIGTAAVAGVAAGWTMGRGMRGDSKHDGAESRADHNGQAESSGSKRSEAEVAHPPSRLVGGLGTLAGALTSVLFGAASEAIAGVVKDTVRDTLRPGPVPSPSKNGSAT